ncbi:PsbP-related protein [Formosa sp. Hel1_31_208]|uniref:PsbP-related protein n=1 Tax=Formosa sp. Hel1_31_208 TaxID=1798225 RepID=UPI0012FDAA1B|nr:PsbP-related protein [Formosa sp. Hel1_31_208]
MKKHIVIASFIICALTACKNNSKSKSESTTSETLENRFEGKGYTFDYPKDWNITDDEPIDEGVHFVSVEKNGFDSSGLFTLVVFEYLVELDDVIKVNMEELQNNSFVETLTFESIVDSQFGNLDARSIGFKLSTMGIKHKGTIYAFEAKNQSFVIIRQGALEDTTKNAEGFDTIENSFSIK